MPTKRELLEEKTVEDLKQMARDKDLSGYSNMRKAELAEFIRDNYLKDEIKAWPDLGLGEVGAEPEPEEAEEEAIDTQEFPADEITSGVSQGREPDLIFVSAVMGAAAAAILAVLILYLGT